MSTVTPVRGLPRAVVTAWLSTVRLPLTAAETVLRRGKDTAEWPPTLAFASFEARVKQVAGSVLHDSTLVEAGRLEQARVGQLSKAAELEAVAQTKRQAAEEEFQQRLQADERERQQAEDRAAEHRQQVVEDAEDAKRRLASEKADAEREARELEDRQRAGVEREERAAERTAIRAEKAALTEQREAAEAKREVLDTERRLQTVKAVRRAKR